MFTWTPNYELLIGGTVNKVRERHGHISMKAHRLYGADNGIVWFQGGRAKDSLFPVLRVGIKEFGQLCREVSHHAMHSQFKRSLKFVLCVQYPQICLKQNMGLLVCIQCLS